MKKVLVVDDSKTILMMLEVELEDIDGIEPIYADSYKSAMKKIRENPGEIKAALLDMNLPDAPNGEIVSLANSHNIPTVVLTGTMNNKVKNFINNNEVVSYVVKGTPKSTTHAIKFIQQILRNYDTTALVVDDSKLYREILSDMLSQMNINVIKASNGQEALDIFRESNQKISLVFTGNEMSMMGGIELTIKIREQYDKDEVAIIALSSSDSKEVVQNFLKFGANDFINKPFTKDAVIASVNSNLDILDLFSRITDMANKDFLTGAYNRRYFFDSGETIFSKAKRKEVPIAVAMIDIDNFKKINDTYGHDVGDVAIKEIKKILDRNLRQTDLMARFGGEEFCIILEDISREDVAMLFERIRKEFEDNVIDIKDITIKYTVSFGIAFGLLDSLEDMVNLADAGLYDSKENGRNQVTIKDT